VRRAYPEHIKFPAQHSALEINQLTWFTRDIFNLSLRSKPLGEFLPFIECRALRQRARRVFGLALEPRLVQFFCHLAVNRRGFAIPYSPGTVRIRQFTNFLHWIALIAAI
jgi:hypothetical protein